MAIRTSTSSARSSSYSTQKAPQKSSSAQRSSSTQRASTPTQNRQTSSAPRRDTFTYSSPTAKQTAPKTSTSKTSTASKSSQSKTSTTKTNAPVRTSSTNQTKKAQPTSSGNSKRRDSFEFSSKDVEKSVRSATNSKSTANGKTTTKNNTKNSTNGQTKKTVKNNSSNKNTVSGSASKSNKSSKNKVPEGLKLHLQHTNDPKQKAGMKKTIKDIENSSSSEKADKTSKKLKELGIDLTTLTFMSDGSKYGAKIIENGQSYEIVPEGDIRLHERGYMTEQDYDKILYIVAHEVGSESINNTEKFATASALINQLEQYWGNGDTIADGLDNFYNYNSCRDDGGIPNIPHEQCIYSREEDSNALKNNVKPEVDLALQGIRAFDKEIQSWLTLDGLHEKYGTNLDVGGKYIINKK